ncbi:hypothetical protein WA577_002132, partial [Blastocystis sp. JDR]
MSNFSTALSAFCSHAGTEQAMQYRDAAVNILKNMRGGVSETIVMQMLIPAEKALHDGIDSGNIPVVVDMLYFFTSCCVELGPTFHMEFNRLRGVIEQCIVCKIENVHNIAKGLLTSAYKYCHHDSINPGYLSYLVSNSNYDVDVIRAVLDCVDIMLAWSSEDLFRQYFRLHSLLSCLLDTQWVNPLPEDLLKRVTEQRARLEELGKNRPEEHKQELNRGAKQEEHKEAEGPKPEAKPEKRRGRCLCVVLLLLFAVAAVFGVSWAACETKMAVSGREREVLEAVCVPYEKGVEVVS